LAQATERSGKPGQLRQVLQRFATALPQSEAAWLSRARLEERERRPVAVRLALDRALAVQPGSTSAL